MGSMELITSARSFFSNLSLWQILTVGILTFVGLKLIRWLLKFWRYHKYFNSMPGETDFHWIYGNLHKLGKPGTERTDMIKYWTEMVKRFPIFHRFWRSPLLAAILCDHYTSARTLLITAGPGEEGMCFMIDESRKYPVFMRVWLGSMIAKMIGYHPCITKDLLKSSEPKPRGIGTPYILGIDWLGEGLLISNGPKWARNRKLLTSAFHFDILQPYINVKNEAADILLEKIENCMKLNKSFELFEYISLCTLDILLRCAFSFRDDIQGLGEKHPYIKAINELGDAWVERSIKPFLFPNFIYYLTSNGRKFARNCKYVHNFAEEIIAKRKRELEETATDGKGNRKYLDFLDILLTAKDENNEGLSQMDIRNEADTFLFEGHDTTTSALSWTIYSLATHPEHQKKIQEEVDQIYAEKHDEYIIMSDIQKMEYMSMCLKEGLRLHSPVPFIERQITKELEIDGYKIPPGTSVAVQIYNLHRNPTVWDDPDEYRPDRFTPENTKNRDAFAFVPFSAGPRNCIGQNFAMHEMKILLARILHKYTLALDTTIPVRRKMSVVMKAENGIHVFAKPRNENIH